MWIIHRCGCQFDVELMLLSPGYPTMKKYSHSQTLFFYQSNIHFGKVKEFETVYKILCSLK